MDLKLLEDFARKATAEIAMYDVRFNLSPERMLAEVGEIENLTWFCIPYGREQIHKVPNDRRGIYAFVVRSENRVLPPHHYVMYIGIAGERSNRPLRARYQDYLNLNAVNKRPRIARMIGTWNRVLCFYFAPVDDAVDSDKLAAVEIALNNALMPPFSQGDLEIDLKRKRRAFQ